MLKALLKVVTAAFFTLFLAVPNFNENHPIKNANTNDTQTTVKIGWYESARFQEGMSDEETKSGYSYEYLQKVCDYNGWEYEYVYGEWSDLLPKLENGEIDAMAGVSDTLEREEKMWFPNYAMGNEGYYIYQHDSNRVLNSNDLSTFEGKKIGAVEDNLMTTYLEEWVAENEVNCDIVMYTGFTERDQDFENGKLDAVVATDNNILSDSGFSPVVKVGSESYYLAITKSRKDLLSELNDALSLLQEMEPYFLQNLQYSCYGNTITNASLSDKEKEWLSTHNTLKIGYMNNYLPFCTKDENGNVYGLITDVMNQVLSKLKATDTLSLEYQSYDNYEEMLSSLKNGNIDTAFPVGGSISDIDEDGINSTSAVISTGMNLVYRGSYSSEKIETIAVNKNNNLQYYYTVNEYPNAKIIFYNSISECLDAVKKEEVGSTILNGLRIDLVKNNSKYSSLSLLQLANSDTRYLGVRKNESTLLLLLNRGLMLIGQNYGNNAAYNYINNLYSYSVADFFSTHWISFSTLLILIFLLILFLILLNLRITKKNQQKLRIQLKKNQLLTKEKEKQILEIKELNEKQIESDKKHQEEMQVALDKAESANNAKTDFLFNMSHDIRTPMNAIIGFTTLLKKYQDDPERREDYLKKIEDANNILLSIINNVLEMARIEKGTMVPEETACDFPSFTESLNTVVMEMMKQKDIQFTYEYHLTHNFVYCDSIKLREVYLNILSNAYKYTNSGGKVSMIIEEKENDQPDYINYQTTISDTGIGMSKEFLPHIFEPFTRENNTTANKIEGTGLGMSIVKRMIEFMHGTIEVESEKNVGSTFIVTIPLRIASEQDIEKEKVAEKKTNNFSGKRILLAEDNELNAEIAIEILSEYGFTIEHAENGKVALDMITNHEAGYYDLILMDVQMPVMNGYEATKAIRSLDDKEKANIPILAMTANAFSEDKQNAKAAGMNGHIAKPINIGSLTKEINSVLK